MKVSIDEDNCRGHGVCCALSPEVFELNDDGYTVVMRPEVPGDHRDAVEAAVSQCPERAIAVE
jgi:ferredoxin